MDSFDAQVGFDNGQNWNKKKTIIRITINQKIFLQKSTHQIWCLELR